MALKIFFCYAHEDEPLLNKLKAHLRPLQRQGLIDMWHDRDIRAGIEWEREIDKHLNTSDIILLLISPDFMNSEYCYGKEMKKAIERRERNETEVIPVILRPVYWQVDPLHKLQALPKDAKPVTDPDWHNIDRAFYNVTEGIKRAAEEVLRKQLLNIGIAFRRAKNYEEALQTIYKVIKLDPTYPPAYYERGIIYRDRPVELEDEGDDYDKALSDFEKAIELDPNYAEAYYEKAVTFLTFRRRGKYSNALTAVEKAIQLNPNYAPAYHLQGIIYRDRPSQSFIRQRRRGLGQEQEDEPDDYIRSLECFEKAIQLVPTEPDFYYDKGMTLKLLERYTQALEAVEKAIELSSKQQYYLLKVDILNILNNYEDALSTYEILIQLAPNNWENFMGKGNALFELARLNEALNAYEEAIQLSPDNSEVYEKVGQVYEQLAQEAYKKAKKFGHNLS